MAHKSLSLSLSLTYCQCTAENEVRLLKTEWSSPVYDQDTHHTKVPYQYDKRGPINRKIVNL